MKRAAVAIPLATVAIGFCLLVWHRAASTSSSPRPPHSETPASPAPSTPPAPPNSSALPRTMEMSGSLLILVHFRGGPIAGAEGTVRAEHGPGKTDFVTARDGRREIRQVPAGHYKVTARTFNYTTGSAHAEVLPGRTTEVSVEIEPAGRLEGVVTDPAGHPVPGAQINVLNPRNQMFLGSLQAASDAQGRYVIDGIAPQEIGLRCQHERYRPWVRLDLQVRAPGETVVVNVAMEAGTAVSGRVLEEGTGRPIAKADVMAVNEHTWTVLTDAEGRFEIVNLGDREIVLSARARGYGIRFLRGVRPNTAGIEIRLQRGSTLAGKVMAEPLPRAFAVSVTRYEEDLKRELRLPFPVQTSFDGSFVVTDLPAGRYWVDVEADGYETVDRPHFVLDAGQSMANLLVRLRKR